MGTTVIVGLSILGVGLFVALVGGLFLLTARAALNEPPAHDGIGGKDSQNLFTGCIGGIVGWAAIVGGGIIATAGLVVSAVGWLF